MYTTSVASLYTTNEISEKEIMKGNIFMTATRQKEKREQARKKTIQCKLLNCSEKNFIT